MIFALEGSHEGIEVTASRRISRAERSPDGRRILRDRAMLLLRRAGLSYTDISEIGQAFKDDPITDRSSVRKRILEAERLAEREAEGAGLLGAD